MIFKQKFRIKTIAYASPCETVIIEGCQSLLYKKTEIKNATKSAQYSQHISSKGCIFKRFIKLTVKDLSLKFSQLNI